MKFQGTIVAARVMLRDGFVGSVHRQNTDGTMIVAGTGKAGFEQRTVSPEDVELCGNDVQERVGNYCNRHGIKLVSMSEITSRGNTYRAN